ncbi:hypothetical protein NS258_07965 [Sphingomonas sanguinis]|uniref:Uncharacterized protein n=1 Tax=Sphingomonas sanguinis TaxID=33051 RepID=A0A147J955_9SPHN|nr:hypothetical protein NS258_07965 [Sphingomonas sanguinis]
MLRLLQQIVAQDRPRIAGGHQGQPPSIRATPAKAGVQLPRSLRSDVDIRHRRHSDWTPAFAGVV